MAEGGNPNEGFTDDTIHRVAIALREADLDEDQIDNAIQVMQEHGILFREYQGPRLFSV